MTQMDGRPLVRYRVLVHDSARWEGFSFRPDDIVISTPAKCGTTWMQMICALLIFQTPVLDQPLSLISPWLDMLTRARDDVVADLDAQTHRRFIKTHTPLDGLPYDARITYLCVGRDPRDVALSMDNHWDNMDTDAFIAARKVAVGLDDVAEQLASTPVRPATPYERFWAWVDNDTPPTEASSSLRRTLHHLDTFWSARDAGNVVMLRYEDLKTDLEGQMRALAARLGIDVPEQCWPSLVAAASFEAMRRNADKTVPNAGNDFWRDPYEFFHRGTSGQWRELLGPDDLVRYDARVATLVAPDLAAWARARGRLERPLDVTIRAEEPADRDAIAEVVAQAFGAPAEARLVELIRASPNFVPELSLVADLDGRVVGHVMVSYVTLHDGRVQHRIASLAPLAVAPRYHGRAVGSALVREVTARADARGEPLVVLEGSPDYYGRFGFEHSVRYGIEITLPGWAPPESAQVLRLRNYDPSLRGRVVYPPAFNEVTEH